MHNALYLSLLQWDFSWGAGHSERLGQYIMSAQAIEEKSYSYQYQPAS